MKLNTYIIALLIAGSLSAQAVSKTGTTAAKFLSVPVDARGTGMGQAVVTGYSDPSTVYWNPSTITLLPSMALNFSYNQYFEGITFNHVSFAMSLVMGGAVAINMNSFTTDEMEVTTERFQEGSGEFFTVGSYSLGAAYARMLTDRFSIGANVKYITERIYNSSAHGFALDMGARYQLPWDKWILGFSISNFGTKMQMNGEDLLTLVDIDPLNSGNNDAITALLTTDKYDIPLNLTIGVAYHAIQSPYMRLTFELDAQHPNDNYELINGGAELALLGEKVFLRGGFAQSHIDAFNGMLSMGGGLRYSLLGAADLMVDYAYQQHDFLSKNQRFSLSLIF